MYRAARPDAADVSFADRTISHLATAVTAAKDARNWACNSVRLDRFGRRVGYRRFAHVVTDQPAIDAGGGDAVMHMLCGRRNVTETIATAVNVHRWLPDGTAICIHDDGTIRDRDLAALARQLVGARVIARSDSDVYVGGLLRSRGLQWCARLRDEFVLNVKLLDVQIYGRGRRILFVDSDVLIHAEPTELARELTQRDEDWKDRFNRDCASSDCWTPNKIREALSADLLPQVNTGLMCLRRDAPDLDWIESTLARFPARDTGRTWYPE